jgi:hypothetical protein
MASSSKRQTTFAKMQREQRVKEKRALKAEKKQAVREAKAAGLMFGGEAVESETLEDGAADEPVAADAGAGAARPD